MPSLCHSEILPSGTRIPPLLEVGSSVRAIGGLPKPGGPGLRETGSLTPAVVNADAIITDDERT